MKKPDKLIYILAGLLTAPFLAVIVKYTIDTNKIREVENCKARLRTVQYGLELYFTKYKTYPDDLTSLIREGFLKSDEDTDLWKNRFLYKRGNYDNYILKSFGPDGQLNTDDDIDAPINPSKPHSKF